MISDSEIEKLLYDDDFEMISDSEIEKLLYDDEDNEMEDVVSNQSTVVDSIQAKTDFLTLFQVPSLSDISDDFSDEFLLRTNPKNSSISVSSNSAEITSKMPSSEYDKDVESEVEYIVEHTPPENDSIKAKTDFLKLFKIPSLSDISQDSDDA